MPLNKAYQILLKHYEKEYKKYWEKIDSDVCEYLKEHPNKKAEDLTILHFNHLTHIQIMDGSHCIGTYDFFKSARIPPFE